MNYSDWILSIYDEYKKQNDEAKDENNNLIKVFKGLKMKLKIKIISFILIMIIGMGMYLYGLLFKRLDIYLWGMMMAIIPILIESYMGKLSLQYYKKNKDILQKVLEDEGFYNEKAIKELIRETEVFFSRVKNYKIGILIKGISSFITILGPTYILSKIDNQIIKISVTIMVVTIIFSGLIYFMLRNISGGKIARRKEFNELLKILLFYKQNSSKEQQETLLN